MQPKTPKLLEDIRDAAAFIRDSVRGKTLDDYHGDRLLRQAIERNFEIIGEAIKRLSHSTIPRSSPESETIVRSSPSATCSYMVTTLSITHWSGAQ
jgi:uncharacterized protein with HEPN domain